MKIFLKTAAVVLSLLVLGFAIAYFAGAFDKVSAASFSEMIAKKTGLESGEFLIPDSIEDKNKKLTKSELGLLFNSVFLSDEVLSGDEAAKKADAERLLNNVLGESTSAEAVGGNRFFSGEELQNKRIEGDLTVISDGGKVTLSGVVATGEIIIISGGSSEISFQNKTTANGGIRLLSKDETLVSSDDAGALDLTVFGKADITADLTSLTISKNAEAKLDCDVVAGRILGGIVRYNSGAFNKLSIEGEAEVLIESSVSGNDLLVSGEKAKMNFSGKLNSAEVSAANALINIKGGSEIEALNITEAASKTTVVIEKSAVTGEILNAGTAAVIDNRSKWDGRI